MCVCVCLKVCGGSGRMKRMENVEGCEEEEHFYSSTVGFYLTFGCGKIYICYMAKCEINKLLQNINYGKIYT